jgi:predicted RNA binding protein YcfA (HicA-like mRNA interferase family)
MPNKIKHISGKEVIKILEHFNFEVSRQKGSHLTMVRMFRGSKQVMLIPNHKTIDRGTLSSIYKKLSRYINDSEAREYFYSE